MDAYYFTFHSMTQAQMAAAILRRHGLSADLVRAPKSISVAGCGNALQLKPSDGYNGLFILRNDGASPRKIFRTDRVGNAREVFL